VDIVPPYIAYLGGLKDYKNFCILQENKLWNFRQKINFVWNSIEQNYIMNKIIPQKNGIIQDLRLIIEQGRRQAYVSINQAVIQTNWNIGRRIVEEEQSGGKRAQYGKRLIASLAEELSVLYGNSYSKRNLEYYRKFYLCFKDLEIVNMRVHNLTWSHFKRIMNVADPEAREWYLKEANIYSISCFP